MTLSAAHVWFLARVAAGFDPSSCLDAAALRVSGLSWSQARRRLAAL